MDNKLIQKKILDLLYDLRLNNNTNKAFPSYIINKLDITENEFDFNLSYLIGKGFVVPEDFTDGFITYTYYVISAEGIDQVDQSTDLVEKILRPLKNRLKVFISYSMNDKDVATKIKEMLAEFGIESFMAHDDIFVSQEWKERILKELNEADVFIPILSHHFRLSDWCSQESGIACFRNILIIPLSLDNTKPYGFMSYRQGKRINDNDIPLNYIMKPIADHFPNINVIEKLIDPLEKCHSYRDCEAEMSNLEPYFDMLDQAQVDRVIDISIKNNQIYPAGLCLTEYLPKFIDINQDKIDEDKLKRLLELMKEYQ